MKETNKELQELNVVLRNNAVNALSKNLEYLNAHFGDFNNILNEYEIYSQQELTCMRRNCEAILSQLNILTRCK